MDASWPRNRLIVAPNLAPILATAGAAFAVGIGYMDPGNWATDLDATRFGDTLLWSILFSGLAAAVLQILVVRFSAAHACGLMEAIAQRFPAASRPLWIVYALSIVVTEVAEFVGIVVGVQMVFGSSLPIAIALAVTILTAMLLASGASTQRFELLAVVTTAGLALVYAFEIGVLKPAAGPILSGTVVPSLAGPGALVAVVGIVGATIMPHNLFLQSGLVRDTVRAAPAYARRSVAKQAVLTTIATLAGATLINAAITVVGTATHADTIERAFRTLRPVAGSTAALLFGLALIAAALAASVSATVAGDMICTPEAALHLTRFRRRVVAIAPAVVLLAIGISPTALLLASQIALGLALPAVVIPLIIIVLGDRIKTATDRGLLAVSVAVVVATCACDGFALTSLLPHL